MKKFILALLVVVALVIMAACGNNDAPTQESAPPVSPTPVATPSPTPAPPVDGGNEGSTGLTRAEILASIPDDPVHGQIIFGSGTQATRNILTGWDNPTPNHQARAMMFGGLGTVSMNLNGDFFHNPIVTRDVVITDNADGSRTYTITIYTDNVFSDGTPITAEHYAANVAFFTNHIWREVADTAAAYQEVVGRAEWISGEANTLTGVRLLSEDTFSVTYGAEWFPYIWEIAYQDHGPFPYFAIIPDAPLKDDGNGVYFDGLTLEMMLNGVNGTDSNGYRFNPTVVPGPYMFTSFDESSSTLVLEVNPNFPGTWDGVRPRIQNIIFSYVPSAVLIDNMSLGQSDVTIGLGGGEQIEAAFEVLQGGGTHRAIAYPRHGYGMIRFHVDHGPTQFVAVRQAIKWLLDRDELVRQFTRGHGAVVQGPYSLSMWQYHEALERGLYDKIIHYTINPARAIEILEADGWVLDANGNPFVLQNPNPADNVRHKELEDGSLMRLQIDWATWVDDQNPVSPIVQILLAGEMQAAGMQLNRINLDNPLTFVSRTGGTGPEFHMFNQGLGMTTLYMPWNALNPSPDFMGGGFNNNFVEDQELFEMAERLRFMDISTDEGRSEYIDAYIDLMVRLNYLVLDIPLYADIYYDFVPNRLQNWENNPLWGFANAIIRAYVTE
jgi:peptide/nickel transport system substrate-binding protein